MKKIKKKSISSRIEILNRILKLAAKGIYQAEKEFGGLVEKAIPSFKSGYQAVFADDEKYKGLVEKYIDDTIGALKYLQTNKSIIESEGKNQGSKDESPYIKRFIKKFNLNSPTKQKAREAIERGDSTLPWAQEPESLGKIGPGVGGFIDPAITSPKLYLAKVQQALNEKTYFQNDENVSVSLNYSYDKRVRVLRHFLFKNRSELVREDKLQAINEADQKVNEMKHLLQVIGGCVKSDYDQLLEKYKSIFGEETSRTKNTDSVRKELDISKKLFNKLLDEELNSLSVLNTSTVSVPESNYNPESEQVKLFYDLINLTRAKASVPCNASNNKTPLFLARLLPQIKENPYLVRLEIKNGKNIGIYQIENFDVNGFTISKDMDRARAVASKLTNLQNNYRGPEGKTKLEQMESGEKSGDELYWPDLSSEESLSEPAKQNLRKFKIEDLDKDKGSFDVFTELYIKIEKCLKDAEQLKLEFLDKKSIPAKQLSKEVKPLTKILSIVHEIADHVSDFTVPGGLFDSYLESVKTSYGEQGLVSLLNFYGIYPQKVDIENVKEMNQRWKMDVDREVSFFKYSVVSCIKLFGDQLALLSTRLANTVAYYAEQDYFKESRLMREKRCKECDKTSPEEAVVCVHCGNKEFSGTDPKICNKCKEYNLASAEKCAHCGADEKELKAVKQNISSLADPEARIVNIEKGAPVQTAVSDKQLITQLTLFFGWYKLFGSSDIKGRTNVAYENIHERSEEFGNKFSGTYGFLSRVKERIELIDKNIAIMNHIIYDNKQNALAKKASAFGRGKEARDIENRFLRSVAELSKLRLFYDYTLKSSLLVLEGIINEIGYGDFDVSTLTDYFNNAEVAKQLRMITESSAETPILANVPERESISYKAPQKGLPEGGMSIEQEPEEEFQDFSTGLFRLNANQKGNKPVLLKQTKEILDFVKVSRLKHFSPELFSSMEMYVRPRSVYGIIFSNIGSVSHLSQLYSKNIAFYSIIEQIKKTRGEEKEELREKFKTDIKQTFAPLDERRKDLLTGKPVIKEVSEDVNYDPSIKEAPAIKDPEAKPSSEEESSFLLDKLKSFRSQKKQDKEIDRPTLESNINEAAKEISRESNKILASSNLLKKEISKKIIEEEEEEDEEVSEAEESVEEKEEKQKVFMSILSSVDKLKIVTNMGKTLQFKVKRYVDKKGKVFLPCEINKELVGKEYKETHVLDDICVCDVPYLTDPNDTLYLGAEKSTIEEVGEDGEVTNVPLVVSECLRLTLEKYNESGGINNEALKIARGRINQARRTVYGTGYSRMIDKLSNMIDKNQSVSVEDLQRQNPRMAKALRGLIDFAKTDRQFDGTINRRIYNEYLGQQELNDIEELKAKIPQINKRKAEVKKLLEDAEMLVAEKKKIFNKEKTDAAKIDYESAVEKLKKLERVYPNLKNAITIGFIKAVDSKLYGKLFEIDPQKNGEKLFNFLQRRKWNITPANIAEYLVQKDNANAESGSDQKIKGIDASKLIAGILAKIRINDPGFDADTIDLTNLESDIALRLSEMSPRERQEFRNLSEEERQNRLVTMGAEWFKEHYLAGPDIKHEPAAKWSGERE